MGAALIPTGLLGIAFQPAILIGWLLVGWGAMWWVRRQSPRSTHRPTAVVRPARVNFWFCLFASLTAANVITAGVIAFHVPVGVWDVQQFWMPKAELLSPPGTLRSLAASTYPDYPPLWPVHIALTRLIAVTPATAKLLPVTYLAAFLAVVFAYLTERTNRITAVAAVWVISGIPYLHYAYGLSDLLAEVPIMCLVGAATISAARYYASRATHEAIAALVFASTVVLIRPEGFQFALVVGFLLAPCAWYHRHRGLAIVSLMVPTAVFAAWQSVVRFSFGRGSTYRPTAIHWDGELLRVLGRVLRYAGGELSHPYLFGPTLIGFALLVVGFRSWRRWGLFAVVLAASVGMICATYVVLPFTNGQPLEWWLQTGFKRMLLHFVPLLTIASAVATHAMTESERSPVDVRRSSPSWRTAIGYSLAALILIGAAVHTSGWLRSRSLHLTSLSPNGQRNLYAAVTYGNEKGWWQPQTPGSVDAIMTCPADNISSVVSYDLNNLGVRGGSESVFDRFVRFETRVGVVATEVGQVRFLVYADDHEVAATGPMTGRSGTAVLSAKLPPWTRVLRLVVDPMGSGNSDHAVWFEPTLQRAGSGPLVAVILLVAACAAVGSALASTGVRWAEMPARLCGSRPILIALLAAGLILQLDAIANRLLRPGFF
jgi:hypothetical protein